MKDFIILFIISSIYSADCNMELVGTLEFGQETSDITGYFQDGREFAVVGLIEDVAVFVEVTNPEYPIELARIVQTSDSGCDGKDYCDWRDLKYWNRHVYIGSEATFGVKVVSVDDPDNPDEIQSITDFTQSHNIHIDEDGYLYVIGAEEHDVWIYELTDHPENPELVGTWDGEYLHDIEVYNNKLYGAAIRSGQFYILDVSDKTDPATILTHQTGGIKTHDCAVTYDEHYLITADETRGGHIKIWDIQDHNNINLVSEYQTHPDHSVHNIYVHPETNLVIMSYYVDGTRVLDISDPENPREVGYFDTCSLEVDTLNLENTLYNGHWGTYIDLPSGYIISSDQQNGLFITGSNLTNEEMEWSLCQTGCMDEEASNYDPDATVAGNCVYSAANNIPTIPNNYSISNIYPNPFNPITSIEYNLPENATIDLSVYNINGKQIQTLVQGFQTAGYHSTYWNASARSSGLYFISMVSGQYVLTQKLMLIK